MNKWIKAVLQIVIGLVLLHFGVPLLLENGEAFTWLRWGALLGGAGFACAGAENILDLTDRYERWR